MPYSRLGDKESDIRVNALNPGDLQPQQIGLFLDVDGTLLDLAPRPEAVEDPPRLVDTLAAAQLHLRGALTLVSGGPIEQLDRLLPPLQLPATRVDGPHLPPTAHRPIK